MKVEVEHCQECGAKRSLETTLSTCSDILSTFRILNSLFTRFLVIR
jgi:hypothetical protein